MKVGIAPQPQSDAAETLAVDLYHMLSQTGVTPLLPPTIAVPDIANRAPLPEMTSCSLVVSIGGDGTFLHTARAVGSVPIIGVNLGEVGFLNAVPPNDAVETIQSEVEYARNHGEPRYREVPRLETPHLPPALNEITVLGTQRGRNQGIHADVRVNDSSYYTDHSDGVIIATPTGSTAYNLSEGGPLIHPNANVLVITGMCSQSRLPPLVIPTDAELTIHVTQANQAVIASDGETVTMETPVEIPIQTADEPGRIAGPPSDFFDALGKIDRSISMNSSFV